VIRPIVNVIVFLLVLWLNGMAGAGTLSGESIGLVANRHTSFFLPANYVFGIWSLIYLMLTAFTVYQALPGRWDRPVQRRIGWWWAVNGVLNIAWVVLFSFSLFGPSLAIMVALLANLVLIHLRIAAEPGSLDLWDRALVAWTFDLYLAWISVALISNTFQYLTFVQWGGWGVPGEVWSAGMMTVATGLGAFMALRRGAWIFPVVVAWALWGIGARFADITVIHAPSRVLVVACVILAAAGLVMRHRAIPHATGPASAA